MKQAQNYRYCHNVHFPCGPAPFPTGILERLFVLPIGTLYWSTVIHP